MKGFWFGHILAMPPPRQADSEKATLGLKEKATLGLNEKAPASEASRPPGNFPTTPSPTRRNSSTTLCGQDPGVVPPKEVFQRTALVRCFSVLFIFHSNSIFIFVLINAFNLYSVFAP